MSYSREVVISGISGRFPDCASVDEFKKKLFTCSYLQRPDESRWNVLLSDSPFITGKIPHWNRYDATFFGITSKLLRSCDPILGMCLETSFEAMIDAGLNPYAMSGRSIAVVSTSSLSDAEALRCCDSCYVDGLGMVGHARTMLANRISYCFNFNGPSYNCDDSWTSSNQGLEIAANMLSRGEVEGVIITSCNLALFYAQDLAYQEMGMLSSDGVTRPFDDQANGFARSECAVAIYLQRATDARRNYCSVLKTETCALGDRTCCYVGFDGRVSDNIMNFYNECKVNVGDISYLETHSIGCHNSDALELNALAETFTPSKENPLLVGSLGGNVGNCESASGPVSLAKVIIAMESGVIPPTINYKTPSSKVPAISDGRIKIVTEPTALTGDLVGINTFSLSGSVSHVLVKRNCKTGDCQSEDRLPRLVLLQARHEDGAQQILNKISTMPKNKSFLSLVNDVFKVRIPAYLWRAYALLPADSSKPRMESQAYDSTARPVWYVFSGMGSQWAGMGRDLLRIPVFMAAIDRCDRVLRPIGLDIKHIITTDETSVFDKVLNCFVGIAAIQIGLVDILRSLGVTPDGMVGHSVGELACGYVDGCLTAEQMILAAYARGKASLDCDNIPGMMAAVGLGYSDIKHHLPPSIDVACHNSPTSCTLSGPTSDVMDYVDKLKQDGVFAKAVSAGGVAYHSRHVKHIGFKLLQHLKKVIPDPKPRSARWVSSSVPQDQWDSLDSQLCSAEYHTNNLLSPVLFEEACRHVPENAILIEIAPRGLLQAILKRSMPPGCINLALTCHNSPSNVNHLFTTIGQLFMNNVNVDVNALYPAVSYPVGQGCPSLASLITWDHDSDLYQEFSSKVKNFLDKGSAETTVGIGDDNPDYELWSHRKINGEVVLPVFHFLAYTWQFIIKTKRQDLDHSWVSIEDFVFPLPTQLLSTGKYLTISCTPINLKFELSVGNCMNTKLQIANGKFQRNIIGNLTQICIPKDLSNTEVISKTELYSVLDRFGLQLGPSLQIVKNLHVGINKCYSTVEWRGNVSVFLDGLLHIATFLQVDQLQRLLIPTALRKLVVDIAFFDKLAPGSNIDVMYDIHCNRLICQGVEMVGMSFTEISPGKTASFYWSKLSLKPLTDKLSLSEFLMTCVQLVSNTGLSCWRANPSPVCVLVIKDEKEKHTLFTRQFSRLYRKQAHTSKLEIHEKSVEEAQEMLSKQTKELYLLTGNLNRIMYVEEFMLNHNNVYALANMNENGKTHPNSNYRQILTTTTEGVKLALMKSGSKINDAKVYKIEDSDWLDSLRQYVENGNGNSTVIVVSTDKTPVEVLPQLANERYADRIRSFFILDKDAPRFTVSCQLYRDQLSLGLPVNILSGGTWSSLNQIWLDIKYKNIPHITCNNPTLDVYCIGLNTTHCTLDLHDDEEEGIIKHVDYSGTLNGQRVMGVGRLESYTNKLTPDHTLQWSVPDSWTMEEAATVPVVYTLAYYCVMLKARVKPGETVLVQAGLSPVGQAVIRVVLEVGGVVIASVLDDDQAIQLKRLLPQIDTKQIIDLSHQDLRIAVKNLTRGRGVDVVVNCLRGNVLQSSVSIMNRECRFIHLGKIKPEDCEAVGMSVFLKMTSFYGVSLDSVAYSPDNEKDLIKDIFTAGISRGTVKPIQRKKNYQDGFKTELFPRMTPLEGQKTTISMKTSANNGLEKNYKKTDLAILIGSMKSDLWIDVIEWLNMAGYTKVVMLTEKEEEDNCNDIDHFRRLNQLVHRHNNNVIVTSSSRLNSTKNARNLLKELNCLGHIAAIITVNIDENNERVVNLDAASRQLAHPVRQWVSLLGRGEAVSQSRMSAGLSVCCVRTISPLRSPARLLQDLWTVLDVEKPSATFLLVRESTSTAERKEYDNGAIWQLSQNKMATLADLVTERPVFTEEVTRSPGHHLVCRDLLPLFVVPGVGGERLNSLLQSLIHPAYLSSFPATISTVQEHAALLTQDIVKIQEKGQYNILCDLWSSAVTLEMCCQLESRGHTVQLFLLEGGPVMAQERLRAFCERRNTDLATSLVAETCNLTPEITKKISQLQEWEDKLGVGLRAGQVPETVKAKLCRSLTSIYYQLTALQLFQGSSQLFRGDLTVISHQELSLSVVDSLTQMCQRRPKLKVTHDKSYQDLLNNYNTATFINDNMFFDWTL